MRIRSAVRPTAPFFALAIGAALMILAVISLRTAEGADHADAPGVASEKAADITDVYAFRSPSNPNNLVVALNVNPLTAPADNATSNFDPTVDYQIMVDTNGDLTPDATITVRFSGSGGRIFSVTGLGPVISGEVTLPSAQPGAAPTARITTTAGGISVFAGQRDDPFFFDLVGFKNFLARPVTPAAGLRPAGQLPSDTFAGTNVSSIVIELPITAVTGAATANTGVIKAWATTSRAGRRIDRMAIPAINTVLLPAASKDAFNAGDPINDATAFRAMGEATVTGLRSAVLPILGPESSGPLGSLTAAQVAGALIPDVVTIDFSMPVVFPNGRQLQDDVINAALGIVLNRGAAAGISDGVDANDKAFGTAFPYMAAPTEPLTAPATPVTPPAAAPAPAKTGNAGLATGDHNAPIAALVLGAVLMVAGGAVLVRRRNAS